MKWMMKLIWYLPIWGQKLIVEELHPFLFEKFDLGHPVEWNPLPKLGAIPE